MRPLAAKVTKWSQMVNNHLGLVSTVALRPNTPTKLFFSIKNNFFPIFLYLRPMASQSQCLDTYCYSFISPHPDSHFETKYAWIVQFKLPKNNLFLITWKTPPFSGGTSIHTIYFYVYFLKGLDLLFHISNFLVLPKVWMLFP